MPEGPSIYLLREEAAPFEGRTVQAAEGNTTTVDKARFVGRRVQAVRSWGKHFLMDFGGFALRVHFLLFGTYRINERKDTASPRLRLRFDDDSEINFYTCSVQIVEGALEDTYDWRRDLLSDRWDPALAEEALRRMPDTLVCDALLDQDVFAGSGNIIKNEVLFRIRVHPLSTLGALPQEQHAALIEQARQYSFDFLAWKREHVLKQHWLAHTRSLCPRCDIPFKKGKLGKTARRSFYCERCQILYTGDASQARRVAARRGRAAPKPGSTKSRGAR